MADASTAETPAPSAPPRNGVSPDGSPPLENPDAPTPQAPERPRRGRPPGRRTGEGRGRSPRPSRARTTQHAVPPPASASPFDGRASSQGTAPDAKQEPPKVDPTTFLPAAELAQVAVGMLSEVSSIVASMRYSRDIAATVRFSPADEALLTPLLAQSLSGAGLKMDPGTAFCVVGGLLLGMKFIAAERTARARLGEQQ